VSAPEFLTLDDVLFIHGDQIERYGGDPGLRDVGLLESAVTMPAAGFGDEYLHASLHEMAAAYAHHLVANHPFVDGNKRAGAAAALVFLDLNGIELTCANAQLEETILRVARGEMNKSDVAAFFRDHARPSSRRT